MGQLSHIDSAAQPVFTPNSASAHQHARSIPGPSGRTAGSGDGDLKGSVQPMNVEKHVGIQPVLRFGLPAGNELLKHHPDHHGQNAETKCQTHGLGAIATTVVGDQLRQGVDMDWANAAHDEDARGAFRRTQNPQHKKTNNWRPGTGAFGQSRQAEQQPRYALECAVIPAFPISSHSCLRRRRAA